MYFVVLYKSCNSTYRLRYWNSITHKFSDNIFRLQQHLPFTVLKHGNIPQDISDMIYGCNSTYRLRYWNKVDYTANRGIDEGMVATALTVYGIETSINWCGFDPIDKGCNSTYRLRYWNWGIFLYIWTCCVKYVATALTVYGIETLHFWGSKNLYQKPLQQHLPFTVLKLTLRVLLSSIIKRLQQHLPFTVLKQSRFNTKRFYSLLCCNSTYRLRYWNLHMAGRRNANVWVATALTVYGIETLSKDCIAIVPKLELQQHLPFTVLKHTYIKWCC